MKRAVVSLSLALLLVAPASRADVSLGANFGAVVSVPRGDAPTRVGVGWPYSNAGTYVATPGIRFGFTGGAGHHEGYLDSTFVYHSRGGTRVLLLTGNYQYNFAGRANGFFFTAGGGPLVYGDADGDDVTMLVGGGVGFRQRIASGAGTLREELRIDFVPGRRHRIPSAFLVGVKLGFDLWFR